MAANTKVVLENLVDGYLADASSIRGSLIVFGTLAERNGIESTPMKMSLVVGSICYVSAEDKFYKWDGSKWVDGLLTRESVVSLLSGKADVSSTEFVYEQAVAASTWNVTHNMGKYPNVTVVDSGNTAVVGETTYIDANNLTLTFSSAFSGKAYLS